MNANALAKIRACSRAIHFMHFEFATAARIIFGPGTLSQVGPIVASFGKHALVVIGSSVERAKPLLDQLDAQRVAAKTFQVSGEPTVDLVQQGMALARSEHCDQVIGFGGGSAIDAGKAVAALLTNTGDILDYLEVIGKSQPIQNAPVPFIAIPTTAGSGAEVTRNAVLASPEHKMKASLRGPLMLPRVALVDPELTYGLPPSVTASTGMDALSQLIEPFVSTRANPLADAIAREGMRRAARSLHRAFENGSDMVAREDMSLASLFGGLALANAGLGAVHGFASPIGGMFPAPHGAVCARLLAPVVEMNVKALRERQPESDVLPRYQEVAQILTANPKATIHDGLSWLNELSVALRIPPLSGYGMSAADVSALVQKAAVASSMKTNPIKLTDEEMMEILSAAL